MKASPAPKQGRCRGDQKPHNSYPNTLRPLIMTSKRTPERRSPLRLVLTVIAAILLIPFVLMAVMMPMMWMGGGMSTVGAVSMSPLWGVGMMLAVLVVVLGVGYVLYRALTRAGLSSRDPALRELRVAYAQGELSEDEFKQRKDILEDTNH